MPRTNTLLTVLLAWCCLWLLPACLAVPIPRGHKNIERAGKKIPESSLSFVVPGQTTKAEFIEKVGQPYLRLDDYGVMAYYWKMLDVSIPWVAAGPYAAAGGIGEVQSQYLLLVSYNDQGVINTYEIIRKRQIKEPLFQSSSIYEQALAWAGKDSSLGRAFTPEKVPPGKAVVYVFHRFNPSAMQQSPHHLDGVFLDGNLWAELKWGQYAPIIVSPGSHTIGFERDIRTTDKFLHPGREAPVPALTTTIDILPNQAYFLEISFIERDSRDYKKTAIFSELSEGVALPKLAGLKRAR